MRLGANVWGNCGARVAARRDPHLIGLVVATCGGPALIAMAEDGKPLRETVREWVRVGSPSHAAALSPPSPTEEA